MSVATEISRLQNAKADIKTAIEAKGVTVPSSATIDSYNTYINQIQTGGGGGTNYLEQYVNRSLSGSINSTQLGTNIGSNMAEYLFYGQIKITSVDLTGTGTTKIANSFCTNSHLTSVVVPDTVTEIGNNFCQSSLLNSITIPSSVIKIGSYFLGGSRVTSLTIPSTVISLGNYCFNNSSYIQTVIYNANTYSIPQSFCKDTDNLTLVDINSSVSSISAYCMGRRSASTNLLEVVLRKTDAIVTVSNPIGDTGFSAAFRNRHNIKLYVPSALIASYEANPNWAAGITAGYLTIVALEGSQYE